MQFHSFEFIFLFIPLVALGYALFGRVSADAAKLWLIVCSLVFFCWGEPRALLVLVGSILFNFWVSRGLDPNLSTSAQRLKFALIVNIAVLGIFKYAGFAFHNVNALFGTHWSFQALLLPMG